MKKKRKTPIEHWSKTYPDVEIQSADVLGLPDARTFVVNTIDAMWAQWHQRITTRAQEDMGTPFRKDLLIEGERKPVWFIFVGPELLVLDTQAADVIIKYAQQHEEWDDGSDWWRND